MRLDFNVLWVDDQPDAVKSQITALARDMAEEGFELNPTMCPGLEEVQQWLAEDIFTDEIDLILVDWELGAGVKGETVISRIREQIHYKDIIFYSAVTNTETLRIASFREGLEGIYFVHRDDLVVEVNALFRSMIKKVLDLDHIRGIVMGATSDVDQMARECLQMAHDLLDVDGKESVLQEMLARLGEKEPDLAKRIKKLTDSPSVARILAEHLTFTAYDGLRILSRILDNDAFKALRLHKEHLKVYIKQVVPRRNILGHKVLNPEGRPVAIAAGPGETIGIEELRELRRLLLDLRQKFRYLHTSLAGMP